MRCGSSIGQVSVKCRSSIVELSVMYRPSIGHVSVMYRSSIDGLRLYRSTYLSADYRSIYRPTIGRLSADYRSTIGRLSADYRSTIGRLSVDISTDSRPKYRPRPPLIHMIHVILLVWLGMAPVVCEKYNVIMSIVKRSLSAGNNLQQSCS